MDRHEQARIENFIEQVKVYTKHSTCGRLRVACCAIPYLACEKPVFGANYSHFGNGTTFDGEEITCDTHCHQLVDNHCVRPIHAEQAMLIQALRSGISIVGRTLIVTHTPCITCSILMIEAGIKKIFIGEQYKPQHFIYQWFRNAGIEVYDWQFNRLEW
jgi:dCMP deaminase